MGHSSSSSSNKNNNYNTNYYYIMLNYYIMVTVGDFFVTNVVLTCPATSEKHIVSVSRQTLINISAVRLVEWS